MFCTKPRNDSFCWIRLAMPSSSAWASMVFDGKPRRNMPLVMSPGTNHDRRISIQQPVSDLCAGDDHRHSEPVNGIRHGQAAHAREQLIDPRP